MRRTTMRRAIRFLSILSLLINADSKLIIEPKETEVLAGDSTYFNCSNSAGEQDVHWYFYRVGATEDQKEHIYGDGKFYENYADRFQIERPSSGDYNLLIRSVKLEDAGRYLCQDGAENETSSSAQLIVLAATPVCQSQMEKEEILGANDCGLEPEEVKLSCSVTYHGNISPVIRWRSAGGKTSTGVNPTISSAKNNSAHIVITYNVTMSADMAPPVDGHAFYCETTQSTYQCAIQTSKVLYAFSNNLVITGKINDPIECLANTSQICSYSWKWFHDDNVTVESYHSTLMPKKVGRHRCLATCQIQSTTCTFPVMLVNVVDEESSVTPNTDLLRNVFIVLLFILILVVICAVIVSLYLKIKKKKKKSREKSKEEYELEIIERDLVQQNPQAIYGITILDNELFVSRLREATINVYDSTTFNRKRTITVVGMTNPEPIISCPINKCLYTFDWDYEGCETLILKINPTNGRLLKNWDTHKGEGRLSVAMDGNVIVNSRFNVSLIEFSADGVLIRLINLASGTGISHVEHAVKLRSGLFVVCHHGDKLSRVCLVRVLEKVNQYGYYDTELIKYFDGQNESGNALKNPSFLAVNESETIAVADLGKNRILLLNSSLDCPIEIKEQQKKKIEEPLIGSDGDIWRVCFDKLNDRWVLADDRRLFIYKLTNGQPIKCQQYFLHDVTLCKC